MAFRFTEEDFRRYVKKEEHGGRHVWDDVKERFKALFGVPFSVVPYRTHGDWLEILWFAPQGGPRSNWDYQAQFMLVRSTQEKRLVYGLDIECPGHSELARLKRDPDGDEKRLIARLEEDPGFAEKWDALVDQPGWEMGVEWWGKKANKNKWQPVRTSRELLEIIKNRPLDQGYSVRLQRGLSAEEAIAAGEGVVDQIMDAYKALRPLWEAVIPEADREFLREDQITESPEEAEARRVFEGVLPDPEVRKMCLNLFADYILQAHAAGDRCWEITLFPKWPGVRLNVGMLRTFDISERCLLVLDASSLSDVDKASLRESGEVSDSGFADVQDAIDVSFDPQRLAEIRPVVARSHTAFIQKASRTNRTSPWWRSHSRGVTAYLRRFLGRDIPDPAYVTIPPPPNDTLRLISSALVDAGLHFTPWQLATFYTALQTKGFVILSGISGTGKTKLAQAFAGLLPQPQEGANWLFVSVRPDWRDSKSLLGYYNPLTGSYEWTDFLRFLLCAERNYRSESRLAWFAILDEMNLAHVEYYFADLLSVLESGRDEEGWTWEPLRLSYPAEARGDLPPRELRLPPNLYIVGTVNVDETTQAFSPKVLDRAFTLELTEADFSAYPPGASEGQADLSDAERRAILEDFGNGGAFARIDKSTIGAYIQEHPEIRERLQRLNELLRPHDLHFGYRVFDEIISFLAAAERNGLYKNLGGAEAAFDAAVLMKVLPKFHGSRGKLEVALKKVLAWSLNPAQPALDAVEDSLQARESADGSAMVEALAELTYTYPQAASRVMRLLRALYETGFAAFA